MERINNDHSPQINCLCEMCKKLRKTKKCPHPHKCLSLATSLIAKIHTRWNPTIGPPHDTDVDTERAASEGSNQNEGITFNKSNGTVDLRDAITIFSESQTCSPNTQPPTQRPATICNSTTMIYTDGACTNNRDKDTTVGYGVWYGKNDP